MCGKTEWYLVSVAGKPPILVEMPIGRGIEDVLLRAYPEIIWRGLRNAPCLVIYLGKNPPERVELGKYLPGTDYTLDLSNIQTIYLPSGSSELSYP